MKMKGTELLVKLLRDEGVEKVFGYPGACVIDIFDALYDCDDIEIILPRHEQALIHAADGYARSTGKTGVCLVTSGPGATNLVTGIATANYDSVPLVCLTGQVATNLIGNDAFQEVDIVGITRSICKYGITVRNRKDLARIIKEAFYIASTGKPGPVVIDLPKDIMLELCEESFDAVSEIDIRGYKPITGVHKGQIKKAVALLRSAEKPLFLIGGGMNIAGAAAEFTQLAERTNVPVATTIMGKGCISTAHPLYVGNVGMHGCYAANMAVSHCDVLFSIGTRFNDRITGKKSEFAKHAQIVHIDIDSSSIARNIEVAVPIVANAKTAVSAMLEIAGSYQKDEWLETISAWKAEKPMQMPQDRGITPEKIIRAVNKLFDEAIITTDVGQHQMWTTQYIELNENKKLITSGGLGTMGYGFPAALGAQLGNENKTVIGISGDGGIQMNIQEMATAVGLGLPLIICIFNNSYLGMVRQWQKLFYDKRYAGTCLRRRKSCDTRCEGPGAACPPYSPDFVKLAESYGAYGIRVEDEKDIEAAFINARNNRNAPTIIEFIIDSEEIVLPMVPGGKALNDMLFS